MISVCFTRAHFTPRQHHHVIPRPSQSPGWANFQSMDAYRIEDYRILVLQWLQWWSTNTSIRLRNRALDGTADRSLTRSKHQPEWTHWHCHSGYSSMLAFATGGVMSKFGLGCSTTRLVTATCGPQMFLYKSTSLELWYQKYLHLLSTTCAMYDTTRIWTVFFLCCTNP